MPEGLYRRYAERLLMVTDFGSPGVFLRHTLSPHTTGIIPYLSRLAGRDLLPMEGEETEALDTLLAGGAIDELARQAATTADGFPTEVTADLIEALRLHS